MQVLPGSYHSTASKLFYCPLFLFIVPLPTLTIMALHSDIQQALLSAAVARHSDTLRRKETENEKLGAHEYQELQRHLNEQKFLSPTDAHTTKANIYYIRIRFSK